MLVGGVDVGSTTTKAVVMKDGKIIANYITRSTVSPKETSRFAMEEALKQVDISSVDELDNIISLGYGRRQVFFANDETSEIRCHAKGAHYLMPDVRTLIDVGGQDSKAIAITPDGKVVDFKMNDRCAAGTGKFYDRMILSLGISHEDISALENQGPNPYQISSQCTVFAETEVITLLNEAFDFRDIIAGINKSVASRICGIVNIVGLKDKLSFSGGCSKNHGLIMAIEKKLKTKVVPLPFDPQFTGALGAALFAAEELESGHAFSKPKSQLPDCPRCSKKSEIIMQCRDCGTPFCQLCYIKTSKTLRRPGLLIGSNFHCPECNGINIKKR